MMTENTVVYHAEPFNMKEHFAGFWMRFWAYVLDVIVIFSLNGLFLSPFKYVNDGIAISVGIWTVPGIIGSIVFFLYFLLMTKFFGQTLGKMILGIKVIRKDGEPLRWSDLVFREVVGRFIYQAFSFLILLYFIVGFTDEKQGLHDIFSDTRVVYDR